MPEFDENVTPPAEHHETYGGHEALWLPTSCGQSGHPRWWSCATCGEHPTGGA